MPSLLPVYVSPLLETHSLMLPRYVQTTKSTSIRNTPSCNSNSTSGYTSVTLGHTQHMPFTTLTSRTSDPVEPIQGASVITSRPFSLPGTLVGTGWLQPRTHSRHGSAKPSPDLPEGHQKDFRTAVEAVEAVKSRVLISKKRKMEEKENLGLRGPPPPILHGAPFTS